MKKKFAAVLLMSFSILAAAACMEKTDVQKELPCTENHEESAQEAALAENAPAEEISRQEMPAEADRKEEIPKETAGHNTVTEELPADEYPEGNAGPVLEESGPEDSVSSDGSSSASLTEIHNNFQVGSVSVTMSMDVPEGWETVIWDVETEIPDWGIEIRADGKENARIMVKGQHGTLNVAQFYPEQPEAFATDQGREGLYYKGEYESEEGERFVDQHIVFGQLDSGFYGISIQMPKAVFEENQEAILDMLRSVKIVEDRKQ